MTWGCDGKARYRTKHYADVVIKRMLRRKRDMEPGHGKINAYRCRFCQHWHVGGST